MGRPITTSQGGTPAIAGRRNKDLRPQRRSRVCPSCRGSSLTANRARSAGAALALWRKIEAMLTAALGVVRWLPVREAGVSVVRPRRGMVRFG